MEKITEIINECSYTRTAKAVILTSILLLLFLTNAIMILQTAIADEWKTTSIDTNGDGKPDLDIRKRSEPSEVHLDLNRNGVIDQGEPHCVGVDKVRAKYVSGQGCYIKISYVFDPEAGESYRAETYRVKNLNKDEDTSDKDECKPISTSYGSSTTKFIDLTHDLIHVYSGVPAVEYFDFVDTEIVELELSAVSKELGCTITVRGGPPVDLENTVFYTLMLDENNVSKDNSMDFPFNDIDTMYTVIYTQAGGWTIERAIYDGFWIVEDTNASFGLASSEPGGFSIDMWIPLTELPGFSEVLYWKVMTETFNGASIGDLAPDGGLAYLGYILGDLNEDGTVDIFDVVNVAIAFGSTPENLDWNPIADFNSDEVVDIFDIVLLANNFGKTT